MILDKLENIGRYAFDLQFVLDDLQKRDFVKGKYDISEPQNFGIGLEYQTRNGDEALWEAHRKYLDIHVILDGEEMIQIADIRNMEEDSIYTHDFQLYKGQPEQTVCLKEGYFLLLFP